jgi:carnitine 3-dehydrogenase
MHPLRVRREIPGHLTDRLQEALWREILHLVNDGVATTGELDDAIVYGPGLRWAAMGTNLIYHLAGGETGMRHMLRQFGPCLKWPWTKLEAPELTEELIDRMVAGTQAQAAGRSIRALERLRDEYLVAIQQVLRQYDIGAGATLRRLEERLHADSAAALAAADESARSPGLLRTLQTQVRPEWIDHHGRMAESRCLQAFGDAADALFRLAGASAHESAGRSLFFPVESHIVQHAPAGALESIVVTTQVLGVDDSNVHLFHNLERRSGGRLVATAQQRYQHASPGEGTSAPMDAAVRAKLEGLRAAHAALPAPAQGGRHVVFPGK